jgi:hypothetical protein
MLIQFNFKDIPDFHTATVANIFDALITQRVIQPSHLNFYYLTYGWLQTCSAPTPAILSNIGIGQHSMLTLCGRMQGGKRPWSGEFLYRLVSPYLRPLTPTHSKRRK